MRYAIGIDLGGTKIEGAFVNEKGAILERLRVHTNAQKGKNHVISQLIYVVKSLKSLRKMPVVGVGVGAPGIVLSDGRIVGSPNVPINGVKLGAILSKNLDLRVVVENDSKCFALAESLFGAGKRVKNMIGLIYGTGIGCGIIINKTLYRGSHGAAGEVGHIVVNPLGPKCGCGLRGDYESYCGGKNIAVRYKQLGGKIKNAGVPQIYYSNEKAAKIVNTDSFTYLVLLCANLINSLDPEIIVLGGGQSNLPIYNQLNAEVRRHVIDLHKKNVRIVRNRLGDSSGVIGAAALVFKA
ncbi:MAG: ROK family protein [Candidatus Woesearchaeota archaeon]